MGRIYFPYYYIKNNWTNTRLIKTAKRERACIHCRKHTNLYIKLHLIISFPIPFLFFFKKSKNLGENCRASGTFFLNFQKKNKYNDLQKHGRRFPDDQKIKPNHKTVKFIILKENQHLR